MYKIFFTTIRYTNGLYSRNPGILFALDKGLKSVNCSNYANFIQKGTFPASYSSSCIKRYKNSNLLFE